MERCLWSMVSRNTHKKGPEHFLTLFFKNNKDLHTEEYVRHFFKELRPGSSSGLAS